MTLSKSRMDCSSTRKSSDKVRTSSNSGSAMWHWRVCGSEDNKQDLNGLANQKKSISSIYPIFLTSRNKDMRSTIQLKKWPSGWTCRISYASSMFADVLICIHIESLLTTFRSFV
jgi:hypothetical protein